jgi:hypothetical protein
MEGRRTESEGGREVKEMKEGRRKRRTGRTEWK